MKEIIDSLKQVIASNNKEAIDNEITTKLNGDNIEEALIHILKNDEQELLAFLLNNKFISNTHLEDIYFTSVMRADKELLEKILPNIQNKTVLNPDGNTALHMAVLSLQQTIDGYKSTNYSELGDLIPRYKEIIDILIKSGISFYTINKEGDSILSYLIKSSLNDVFRYLVDEKGLDINYEDQNGQTVLHFAAKCGNLELVKYLIEEQKLDIDAKASHNRTVLHFAGASGNVELVKYLIEEKNLDINARDDDQRTVLWYAAESGNLELVKYLIEEKNLDMNAKLFLNITLLHKTAQSGNIKLFKYLVEEKKFDINTRDYYRLTVLHYAAESGNLELVKYLIEEKKLDINDMDSSGYTVLHHAAQHGNLKVFKYLVEEKKLNIFIKNYSFYNDDENYKRPLDLLIIQGQLNLIKYILEEYRNDEEMKKELLYSALKYGALKAIKYLVEVQGLDINFKDANGETAIHIAVKGAFYRHQNDDDCYDIFNLEAIKYLIEKGLDTNAKDKNRRTALHTFFKDFKFDYNEDALKEFVEYLVEKGLDIEAQDKDGNTVIDLVFASDIQPAPIMKILANSLNKYNQKLKMANQEFKKKIEALKPLLFSLINNDVNKKRKREHPTQEPKQEDMNFSSSNLGSIKPNDTPDIDTEEKAAKRQKTLETL